MTPSAEYLALQGLRKPPAASVTGDMWLCRRLGIVLVFNAHGRKRGQRAKLNSFHLYHWGRPSLHARPCDWRDDDANAFSGDPARGERMGEAWEYVGNIFHMLPYSSFENVHPVRDV